MKIRLRGQSVRLRLGRSEVAELAKGRAVEESTAFGTTVRFGCTLRPSAGGDAIIHYFADGLLTFDVPAARIAAWAGTHAVGFTEDLPLGDGRSLRLLIEKDFACLTSDGEPQLDAFPNPSAACGPVSESA